MRKTKVKVPAKINLTLDILGKENGYHMLRSLVCSVNVFDEITVKYNPSGDIRVFDDNKCGCMETDNNAYKAAEAFIKETACGGVGIKIKKRIPIGGGMGGSSADAAGTLIAMERLFRTGADLDKIAATVGSDTPYMLRGGYAVIGGRGERCEKVDLNDKLYLLIVIGERMVTSKESYTEFAKAGKKYPPDTDTVLNFFKNGDIEGALLTLKNDLSEASFKISPDIKRNKELLKKAGAMNAVMTGSGCCMVGYFIDKKQRDAAYRKLKFKLRRRLIRAETLSENK